MYQNTQWARPQCLFNHVRVINGSDICDGVLLCGAVSLLLAVICSAPRVTKLSKCGMLNQGKHVLAVLVRLFLQLLHSYFLWPRRVGAMRSGESRRQCCGELFERQSK